MYKKITCVLLVFLSVFQSISFATYDIESIPTWSRLLETIAVPSNKVQLELDSESAILIDETSRHGTIYKK